MAPLRIVGIVMMVLGVIMIIIGLSASESVADQVSNFFTGTFTDSTMWYLLGGVGLAVGGLLLAAYGVRKPK